MSCSCCNHTTSSPTSVCESNPCSTAQNIREIQSSFTPPADTDCTPIFPQLTEEELMQQRDYRPCTDPNGCRAMYPGECRDRFWPDFAHPRWLCCADLY